MAEIGIAPHIVEACLNHISGRTRVARTYNRYKYEPEKRAALELWGRHLDQIISGKKSANVVEIGRGR